MRFPRIRFTLRRLLAFVLFLCVALGWVANRARIQREAVAAIRRAGGNVQYDWQWKDGVTLNGKPWGWSWLVDRVGIDYFGHVTGVHFPVSSGPKAKSALIDVGRLDRLQGLSISSSSVTDADLANIEGLKNLRELYLFRTRITDAGLANLKGLSKLNRLHVYGAEVTDAGLVSLKGLTNLNSLTLYGRAQVTDNGVRKLQEALPKLKVDLPLKRQLPRPRNRIPGRETAPEPSTQDIVQHQSSNKNS